MDATFFNSDIFVLVILPLLIFISRIFDVSIGTVRIIMVSRGYRFFAPILGFFEVLIWLIAIGQIMKNLTNVVCYIAYAGGFGMGTYVGMLIEDKLAMGVCAIRIITRQDTSEMAEQLQASGCGVTIVDAEGATGKVKIIFTIVKRKEASKVIEIIKKFNPNAFFSIEEIRSVDKGVFFPVKPYIEEDFPEKRNMRKGK